MNTMKRSSKKSRLLSLPLLLIAPLWAQFPVHAAPAVPTSTLKTSPLPMMLNGIRESVLSNGVKVLTKEVRGAPVVYFSVWYNVGSVNEQVGQSGMSHLLEHMMFKGTKTRKPGEISAYLQQNGAQFNATTSFDRTNYFETIASDRLEKAMQLEADRMVNSLFDEKEHQKEMTVVRSEYEGGENNPGTALSKAVRLAAFQVHPYRWTPIGFRSDIENISRDEMYNYYRNYYAPENSTVVMVGDFATADAMKMLEKYFGAIPETPDSAPFHHARTGAAGRTPRDRASRRHDAANTNRLSHSRFWRSRPLCSGRFGKRFIRWTHRALL